MLIKTTRKPRNDKGKPRDYPATRAKRIHPERKHGGRYFSLSRRRMQEMQMKLMGYAPPHSAIYTITYNKTRASRYQYTDVFCINNNRLFKISKIVAYILGYKMHHHQYSGRPSVLHGKDCMRIRTFREHEAVNRKEMITNEVDMIKILSTKMFGVDNSYHHESILIMSSEFERTIEQIPNHTKKSYIATSI